MLKDESEIPRFKISNKLVEKEGKDILGDKAIKPTKDNQLPYDLFNMTHGSYVILTPNLGVKLFFEKKTKEGVRQ